MPNKFISLLTHSTNGEDGLSKGIHLRWAFHDKIGFPFGGFELYRRKSDLKKKVCIDLSIKNFKPSTKIPLSFIDNNKKYKIDFSFPKKNKGILPFEFHLPLKEKISSKIIVPKLEKDTIINLPYPVSNIEIEYYVNRKTDGVISINNQKEQTYILNTNKKGTYTYQIIASSIKSLKVEKGILGIKKICFWNCEEDGHEFKQVHRKCKVALPLKLKNELFSKKENNFNENYQLALCHLVSEYISEQNFKEVHDFLAKIHNEGDFVPVGWNKLNDLGVFEECASEEEQGSSPQLNFSFYDLLLLQSLHPRIAKILGLYTIDTDIEPNTYYDYQIVGYWGRKASPLPLRNNPIAKLDYSINFEKYSMSRRFERTIIMLHKEADTNNIINRLFFELDRSALVLPNNEGHYRVEKTLSLSTNLEVTCNIHFTHKAVQVAQVFVMQQGTECSLTAYDQDNNILEYNEIAKDTLILKRGILCVYGNNITKITLKGKGLKIYRIDYDFEDLNVEIAKHTICGIKISNPQRLTKPRGLKAYCLQGSVTRKNEYCADEVLRYRAGLTWNIPRLASGSISANAPIAYLIVRKSPNGIEQQITSSPSPYVVTQSPIDIDDSLLPKTCNPSDTLNQLPLFNDYLANEGRYGYKIAAVDIWGRQSEWTDFVYIDLKPELPPPPVSVEAKYLDWKIFDVSQNTFSDPNLNKRDKEILRQNQQSSIVVRWRWTSKLEEQSPNTLGFRVRLQLGWHNLLEGTITQVQQLPNKQFELQTDLNNITNNSLKNEWLKQGNLIYKIISNTASTLIVEQPNEAVKPSLDTPDEYLYPKSNSAFTLPLTNLKATGGAGIDFKEPDSWQTLLTSIDVNDFGLANNLGYDAATGDYLYEAIILTQQFPDPPFDYLNDEPNKVRYAQIAVNSFNSVGDGSMSASSTIMAIYRKAPPSPTFEDSGSLKATAANYFGKSTFALRWTKPSNPKQMYDVFRAIDESLFLLDQERKKEGSRTNDFYEQYFDEFTQNSNIVLSPAEKAALMAMPPINEDDDNATHKQIKDFYANFTNNQLKALASMPDMTDVFGKLNEKPIKTDDQNYQDRDTSIPLNGTAPSNGNSNQLLYLDQTLDGRSKNKYFYRLQTTDEIGNKSAFSMATLPVEIPQVMPPQAPIITNITAPTDGVIRIEWTANSNTSLIGFKVYRTTDKRLTKDIRRMEWLKQQPTDALSLSIADDAIQHNYALEDETVIPRLPYYYRVVAIREVPHTKLNGEEVILPLASLPSMVGVGQAYDLRLPEPPEWVGVERQNLNNEPAILLQWKTKEKMRCLVKRRTTENANFRGVSAWLDIGVFDGEFWNYTFTDNSFVEEATNYIFQIVGKNTNNMLNNSINFEIN